MNILRLSKLSRLYLFAFGEELSSRRPNRVKSMHNPNFLSDKRILKNIFSLITLFLMMQPLSFSSPSSIRERIEKAGDSPYESERSKIRESRDETLETLYAIQPGSKSAIQDAVGYAVFSNFGMKIFVAGGGAGKGMAVHNQSGREIFMKMVEVQAGIGLGIKQFRMVWVFETDSAFNHFINSGWELGAQATAAAQISDVGGAHQGALSIADGVWLYQMTDNGLALELTAKGTKYYRDKDLNW